MCLHESIASLSGFSAIIHRLIQNSMQKLGLKENRVICFTSLWWSKPLYLFANRTMLY